MIVPDLPPPLVEFAGRKPPAPAWFDSAIADVPERSRVMVDGAGIEVLTWGARGKPGLLFLHGNGAHAGWWDFIAPFFAADYRVAALSWSGMGGSDHRKAYSTTINVEEIFAVATAAGLFDAGKPTIVAHSFGGFAMMAAAHTQGERLAGAVIVDTPFSAAMKRDGTPPNATNRPHKIYPTLAAALARFRFAPPQECANPFIADRIARDSLIEVTDSEGHPGWQWSFDPYMWSNFTADPKNTVLTDPQCPVALIWGDRSALMAGDSIATMRSLLPPGTPAFAIPDAAHHVMIDQPLAFVAALRGLFAGWA